MRKAIVILAAVCAALLSFQALAELPTDIDVGRYSLEELRAIKAAVDDRLAQLEREWAIEHADRTIAFEESEISVFAKKTKKLEAVVTKVAEGAPDRTSLLWTSSDEAIAKVSSDGTVTGVSKGDATITAVAADDDAVFGSVAVRVMLPVEKVVPLTPEETLLLTDDAEAAQADLRVAIEPEDAHFQEVSWQSSKPEVAAVDANGHVTGLIPGQATITATSMEPVAGGSAQKATIAVTVVRAVRGIALSDAELVIDKGKEAQVSALAFPEDATVKKLAWTSGDEEIATVSANGTIRAKRCGECDIFCAATDGSGVRAACRVVVRQRVTGVKFPETKLTMPTSTTVVLEPVVSPEDASDPGLEWASSDKRVATVDHNGKVMAVMAGDCEITCTSTDGSEKSAKVTIHVPTFTIAEKNWTVSDKQGLTIPVAVNGYQSIKAKRTGDCFDNKWQGDGIRIIPLRAGSGTLKVYSEDTDRDTVVLNVTIEHDAVYDSTSYPKAAYADLLGEPDAHRGENTRVYGKVLRVAESGSITVLEVGTAGGAYNDSPFRVEYAPEEVDAAVVEGDYVTIYGTCAGTGTFAPEAGEPVQVPAMRAEKIVVGRQ